MIFANEVNFKKLKKLTFKTIFIMFAQFILTKKFKL